MSTAPSPGGSRGPEASRGDPGARRQAGDSREGDPEGDLFVYGELCRGEVLVEVLGRVPAAVPGLLLDHRRRRNPETGYYEAHVSSDGYVSGLLLRGIESDELARLDEFERVADGLYRRVVARVRMMAQGHPETDAWVYREPGADS